MTEEKYIAISNRVRIQTAQSLLRDVIIWDNDKIIEQKDMDEILYKLWEWTAALFAETRVKCQ